MKNNMKRLKLYQQKIQKITGEIKKIKPEKIILFGSAAFGRITGDSDIDICVIKKTKDRLKVKLQLSELFWKTKVGFEPEIDIHVFPPQVYKDWLRRNDPFIAEIEKGKILYER